jgi:mycothiol synthase
MTVTNRPFAGESDLPRMVALRQAIAARDAFTAVLTPAGARAYYLEPTPDWRTQAQIWELGDDLVAVGELIMPAEQPTPAFAYLRLRLHPDADVRVIGPEIVAWGESEAFRRIGGDVLIEVGVRGNAPETMVLLESFGYERDRTFVRMVRSLETPIPGQVLPGGYVVRPIGGDAEVRAWTALCNRSFQDHYNFFPQTSESHRHEMTDELYVPELDLVAVAPDGSLAALCWAAPRPLADGTSSWEINLVGTAREHRRRGLAGALLARTVELLNARGGTSVELVVDATSETGANRLYKRLGFVEASSSLVYRRSVAFDPVANAAPSTSIT